MSYSKHSSKPSSQTLRTLTLLSVVTLMSLTLQSCIFGRRSPSGASIQEEAKRGNTKVIVDAYLFDVKFKENGKRRSVRLDVYISDSLALFTARAYLGKGVAKGIWRPDSSLFYFPTLKEYFSGPLDEMTRAGCASGGDLQQIIPIIFSGRFPFSIACDEDPPLQIAKQTDKEIEAILTLGECETKVQLVFDLQENSPFWGRLYFLKEFNYIPEDGKGKVTGKRRILKRQKKIKAQKFVLNIPAEAVPVQW